VQLDQILALGAQTNTPCAGVTPTRTFVYSTLSRLHYATNPESGTVSYSYDHNGNVSQQTDARGTVIAMGYDGLNRMKSRNYTPGSSTVATSNVIYQYDQGNFKGALSSVSNGVSSTSYTYDGFGRMATSTQNNGTPYSFSYTYSLTDQLTQITYPSGRVIGYTLDAADRANVVKNVLAGTNYATLQYTAPGGISTLTAGNGTVQTLTWNDRSQPVNLQVTSGVTNLLNLGFYPCSGVAVTSCTSGNNGNLQSQSVTAPSLSVTQTYSYDKLNRLTGASEPGSSGWVQNYQYDPSGNRWVTANTNLPALTLETPTTSSWYSTTVPNRINNWAYDQAGNVLGVTAAGGTTARASCGAGIAPGTAMLRTACYDTENRMVSETDVNGNTGTYAYDGNGLRVSKAVAGTTTTYVYDGFGYLAAEYSTATTSSPCGTQTCYPVLDHLGSTRMLTDATGSNAVKRYDYLPFGQELLASTNGRTTGMGYFASPDGSNPKFTGKDRDNETGFDWFEIRHMSGAQGRFQSVDPGNAGASLGNPQTWNAYSYVGNNPLSYTDPSGEVAAAVVGTAACGPICAVIGGLIDLGELAGFGDLFGGGPESHPLPMQTAGQGVITPGANFSVTTFGISDITPSWSAVDATLDVGALDLGVLFRALGIGRKPVSAVGSNVSGSLPKCVNGFQESTPAQSQSVLNAAASHLGTGYESIGRCTGLVCASIRQSGLNPGFQKNGTVSDVVQNPGLKSISASAARTGDVIVFGTSHMGVYDPAHAGGRTVLSAQGRPGQQQPGVKFGDPLWFKGSVSYYRVMAACR
jgi:RHS repeat-associated protein